MLEVAETYTDQAGEQWLIVENLNELGRFKLNFPFVAASLDTKKYGALNKFNYEGKGIDDITELKLESCKAVHDSRLL